MVVGLNLFGTGYVERELGSSGHMCLDRLRLHVLPPPLLLVIHMCGSLPKQHGKFWIQECDFSLNQGSLACWTSIQEFCRIQTKS